MSNSVPLVLAASGADYVAGAVVAIIVLLVIGLIGLLVYLEARRTKRLAALAAARGFTFRKTPTAADQALLENSQLAGQGRLRQTSNIIEAANVNDFAMTLLDYSYTVGSGKSKQTVVQTVIRMQSPLLQLPAFVMKPESVFAKMGKILGFTDINFPDAPQFSKMYLLRGHDEAAIRQIFGPAIIQYCEQHPKISIEGVGDRLLVYREGRRVKLDNFDNFIEEGKAIAALFVASSQGVPAPPVLHG